VIDHDDDWRTGMSGATPRHHWTDTLVMQHMADPRCPHVHAPIEDEPTCPTLRGYARMRRDDIAHRKDRGW
jgi:hypothetical protein